MRTDGESGAVWDAETVTAYVQDPTGDLREATGESSGRSKMADQVREEEA